MTWYEWGMYLLKVIKNQQRIEYDYNMRKIIAGDILAQQWNTTVDTRKYGLRKRDDYYTIHYDTQLTEEGDPELFNKVARRLGGTIKGKDGGDK